MPLTWAGPYTVETAASGLTWAGPYTVATAALVPGTATGLTGTSPTPTSVALTWIDALSNETGWRVLRRTGANPFAVLAAATALPANTTSFTDTLVASGTTYDYRVVAFNAQGDGAQSSTFTITPGSSQGTPAPGADPTDIPTALEPGAPMYQWIDARGDAHSLSALGAAGVLVGARGLVMPPFALTETETPFADGSRITAVRVPPRDVDLPLLLEANGPEQLRVRVRELAGWFNPTRGDGVLRITDPIGEQRDLSCRYAGGLDAASDDIQQAGPTWWTLAVTLHAADPYFYATVPSTQIFSTAAPVAFFPFFPMVLSASSVISSAQTTNRGDVDAWPIWTIIGPATSVTLTNSTTGQSLTLAVTLASGDRVVIDTRPGRKSVTKTVGAGPTNLLGSITPTSSLWPIAVGINDFAIVMAGSSDVSATVVSYVPRFLGF